MKMIATKPTKSQRHSLQCLILKLKIGVVALYDEMHVDFVGGGGFAIILCSVCGVRVLCGCVASCLCPEPPL